MTDQEFREQHQPLHVPASFEQAKTEQEQVVYALADLGKASADQVVQHLGILSGSAIQQELITTVHQKLSELYAQGYIAGEEHEGKLIYNLQKITQANSGAINPDLLAPGLD